MRYLIVCLALFFTLPTEAQQALTGRRKHLMSRSFMEFTGENCFQITRLEADMAFRERSWDDAAALYRAAKSCADADQAGRSDMSLRIRACRDAAEQELLDKESAARRQARQAIASNRADDAQELLKTFDRSLAYRLADFANQYIAPEGEYNSDCLQAMYDSWYYIPKVHSKLEAGYDSLRIPFCYQLPDDGIQDGIIQFGGQRTAVKLYKLAPSKHLFYIWDAHTLRLESTLPVDTAFTGFQASPNGRTLLFYGKGFFAFWQHGREIFRQKVSQVGTFSFAPDSEQFYYYDSETSKILSLDLQPKYLTQSRKSNATIIKPPVPVPVVSGMATAPAAFAIRPTMLWLGYQDSLIICTKKGDGRPWQRSRIIHFSISDNELENDFSTSILLFPEQEMVVRSTTDTTKFYQIPVEPGRYADLEPSTSLDEPMLGIMPDASLIAKIKSGRGESLYILDPTTITFYFGALTPMDDYFKPGQGAFSPDGRWFAATNQVGLVKLWSLADRQSERLMTYGELNGLARLSPDGRETIMETEGKIDGYTIPQPAVAWSLEIPDKNLGELVVANGWQAYYAGTDSLLVISRNSPALVFAVDSNRMMGNPLVAFDRDEKYVAYAAGPDSVIVCRLPDGQVVAKRAFSGSLRSLVFIPGRHALVIVLQNINDYQQQQNVIKIWDFAGPPAALSTVRLHGYDIQMVAVSPLGDHVAFSNGSTIRVFDLDRLDDEQASIRAINGLTINSLVFQPNSQSLVAGYNNGSIIFWNAETAQFVFEFKNSYESWASAIYQMAFTPDGNRLRYLDYNNHLFERELNPDNIRALAQTTYKQLTAFNSEQILKFNLEPALSYDENFELLANSDDGPLIRSFFEFYQQQALSSNNIEQVGIYCNRAFELYKHLDLDFQKSQRQTMLELYEDLSWKWLLRNKIPQSVRVVAEMNRNFGHSREAVRAGAFTSLLSNDLGAATRFFVNWMMEASEEYLSGDQEGMIKKLRQLTDYDLLDAVQLNYLCALFGELTNVDDKMCPPNAQPMVIPFDADTELRWKILVALHQAGLTNSYLRKVQLLQAAYAQAQTLLRRHPDSRLELEKTALALANSYFAMGNFEQNSSRAADHFRQVIQLLGSTGTFLEDWNRQDLLLRSYLALGDYQLTTNQLDAALATYSSGIKLAAETGAAQKAMLNVNVLSNLYLQRGQVDLGLNKLDAARSDVEAASAQFSDQLNPLYFGPLLWLEGQTTEALTQYDAITDESMLALARFNIQRLAELRPDLRMGMATLDSAVVRRVRVKYSTLDTLLSNYNLVQLRMTHISALKQWSAVVHENQQALRYTERAMQAGYEWNSTVQKWLDAQLQESYAQLFVSKQNPAALSRSILYAERAETYARDSFPGYSYLSLLKTNHAHALALRDGPGDRAKAVVIYRDFLATHEGAYDAWELLQKDFRDLHQAGIEWPRMRDLIAEIKPAGLQLSAADWRDMGVVQ